MVRTGIRKTALSLAVAGAFAGAFRKPRFRIRPDRTERKRSG